MYFQPYKFANIPIFMFYWYDSTLCILHSFSKNQAVISSIIGFHTFQGYKMMCLRFLQVTL